MGGIEWSGGVMDAFSDDLSDDEQSVFYAAPVRGRGVFSASVEGGGGKNVFGAVHPGRPGGQKYSDRTELASGGPHYEEGLMRADTFCGEITARFA